MELNPDHFPQAPGKPDVIVYWLVMLVPLLFLLLSLFKSSVALTELLFPDSTKVSIKDGLIGDLMISLLFSGMMFSVVIYLFGLILKQHRHYKYGQLHPKEPWRWRDRWQKDVVACNTKHSLLRSAFSTAVFNIFIWSIFTVLVYKYSDSTTSVFLLLFSLFMFILSIVSVLLFEVRFRNWFKHGRATLSFKNMPPRIGGNLVATFRGMKNYQEGATMDVTLKCEHREKDDDIVSKDVLWEKTTVHTSDQISAQGDLLLPLDIEMPDDFSLPASNWQLLENQIIWTITVKPALDKPGAHSMEFEIPVFG